VSPVERFLIIVAMLAALPLAWADEPDAAALRIAQEKIQAGEGRAAREILLPLARRGDAAAAYWLGRLYYYDIPGVPRSWPRALDWFAKAANAGHADAQYKLGGMYFAGRGVARDVAKAVSWWIKAAAQLQPEALNNLGALLATGQGVVRDETLGLALQLVAARLGSEAALKNVRNKADKPFFASAQRLAEELAADPERLKRSLEYLGPVN